MIDGTGKHLDGANDSGLGGDFTIEFYSPKTSHQLAPNDGQWQHVTILRTASITHAHFDKEIDGVLFFAHEQRNESGELIEAHYIRADLVNG